MKSGYDLELTRAVSDAVPVPVIASGGVGNVQDLVDGVTKGHASAVLAASIFHFGEVSYRAGEGRTGGCRTAGVVRFRACLHLARLQAAAQFASRVPAWTIPAPPCIPWSAAIWAPIKPVKAVARAICQVACGRKTPSAPPCWIAWPRSPPMPPPCGPGRSVEGLHQLRVAFRRLEVALGAFGREFGQDWLEELRGRAKILSGRLAPARDLDVFVGKLLADPPKSGVQRRAGAACAPAPKARATRPGRGDRLHCQRRFRTVCR